MPHRSTRSRRFAGRALVLSVVGRAAFGPERRGAAGNAVTLESHDDTDAKGLELGLAEATPAVEPRRARRRPKRRLATSLAFATLFFAGASLSAGAGDMIAEAIESTTSTEKTELVEESAPAEEPVVTDVVEEPPVVEETPVEETPVVTEPVEDDASGPAEPSDEPVPGEDEGGEAPSEGTGGEGQGSGGGGSDTPSAGGSPGGQTGGSGSDGGTDAPAPDGPPLIETHDTPVSGPTPPDPEVGEAGGAATIWLHKSMPDPTPAARRLTTAFARTLRNQAAKEKVDWALVLGVLRADGKVGREPATRDQLGQLARRLADLGARKDEWSAALALRGRTAFADRAVAAARLHRAVGLKSLVTGLEAAKPRLVRLTLADSRIDVYPGGRADIQAGRIDIRVLTTLRYLAEAFGQVTVSSLQSGHRIYSRPGVVSAHVYGLAVDIAALGGLSILGNQAPGSITEQAVRAILLLPPGLQARQVISLIGMGGSSFAMANHHDHIHIGF